MKHRFLLNELAAVAVLSSLPFFFCSATRPNLSYTLNGKYLSANLSDMKLMVVFPDEKHIIINNKEDVADDFGGINATPESRIRKFYFPEVFSTLKSLASGDSIFLFDQYCPDVDWDTLCVSEITLRTGSDSTGVPYSIPEKQRMEAVGLDSAVLVFFQEVEFVRNKFQIEYYWDDRSRKPANLEVIAKVLIWNYKEDEPVFNGFLSEKTEFQFGLQRRHWDESARSLAKKLVVAARCL
ncbi:MAG: hypothetical protein JW699_08645 [Chitinispirillaceae bacterium]|nr:hypothetical protein [Chitinispirillaceae bacterium]